MALAFKLLPSSNVITGESVMIASRECVSRLNYRNCASSGRGQEEEEEVGGGSPHAILPRYRAARDSRTSALPELAAAAAASTSPLPANVRVTEFDGSGLDAPLIGKMRRLFVAECIVCRILTYERLQLDLRRAWHV